MASGSKSNYNVADEVITGDVNTIRFFIQETNAATEHIVSENEIMLHYIEKYSIFLDQQDDTSSRQRSFTLRMRAKPNATERLQGLNAMQKCNIAATEGDFIGQRIKNLVEESEKILEVFNVKFRLKARAEIQKQFVNFKSAVLKGDVNNVTDVPKAEKLIRYQEKFMLSRETLILQLRLKNPLLQEKIKRLESWARRTGQYEEQPKKIDFKCIQRSNLQFAEELHNRNKKLRELKVLSSNANYFKRKYKETLRIEMDDKEWCSRRIGTRVTRSSAVAAGCGLICKQTEVEKDDQRELIYRAGNYRVPSIPEFIRTQAELKAIERQLKVAKRQKRLAQMTCAYAKSRLHIPDVPQPQTHSQLRRCRH
ncbi:hypothetical protein D915_003443 [Fasciola hepatica]|uniref:Cilia- and flagella-associated protein 263 n=1 Tax=Fasciola hepatica TaxID=6192 RepID=A0A4E0RE96_FASHE|nr:hypothetical protein D915_003443 [Fasciola hepatica]